MHVKCCKQQDFMVNIVPSKDVTKKSFNIGGNYIAEVFVFHCVCASANAKPVLWLCLQAMYPDLYFVL